MQPTRIRTTNQACPRCQANLEVLKRGIMVAEHPQPVRWVVDRRFCPAGCALTIDDFPDEDSELHA